MKIDFKKKASEIVGHLGDNRPADQIVYLYFAEKVLKEAWNEAIEQSIEKTWYACKCESTSCKCLGNASNKIRELKEKM